MPADPRFNGPRVSMSFFLIGSEMVSFTLFGLLLDYVLGTLPVLTVVLTLLGVATAFFLLIKMSRALTTNKTNIPNGSPESGQ